MASAASKFTRGTNDRFSAEAASWDLNKFVNVASLEAVKAILQRFPALTSIQQAPTLDVLEIGCGTGLLSVLIAPYVRQIVAIDAADGMIEVLMRKIYEGQAPTNIIPVCVLLEDPEDTALPPASAESPDGDRLKFDLINSHLVLHHIPDLKVVLRTMFECLKPGGSVALTDFENFGPEASRFHPKAKMSGVERHGIEPRSMVALMQDVGFINVRVDRAWTMNKMVEKYEGEFDTRGYAGIGEGEHMDFPFVICMGEKQQ